MSYANQTSVPIERSRNEIEQTLIRYGVEEFFYGNSSRGSGIGFKYKGRVIKINVPLPDRKSYRDNASGEKEWQQEQRRRWRVLLLWIKANLELIDTGLMDFEDIFLAQTCLPTGETFKDVLQPQINNWIETGQTPKLLTGFVEEKK